MSESRAQTARWRFVKRYSQSLARAERKRLAVAVALAVAVHATALALVGLSAFSPTPAPASPAVTWVLDPAPRATPDTRRIAAANQQKGAGAHEQPPVPRTPPHSPREKPETSHVATDAGTREPQTRPQPTPQPQPQRSPSLASGNVKAAKRDGLAAKKDARAAYLAAWRRRIEREGNRHFPSEAVIAQARRAPIVQVEIQPDGKLQSVRIVRSSGSSALDRTAKRILHATAPFKALPDVLREGRRGTLKLTYEWHFVKQFVGRPDNRKGLSGGN